jgi:subtilisin family serine protease
MGKRCFSGLLILLFVLGLVIPVAGQPAAADSDLKASYVPGEVLVRFAPAAQPQVAALEQGVLPQRLVRQGITGARRLFYPSEQKRITASGLDRVYLLRLAPNTDVSRVIAALRADPSVEYAEPNYILRATVIPDDPYYFQQWGLTQIGAEEAWEITRGAVTMTIAILDTGLDLNHPDLAGRLWVNPGEVPGDGVDNDGNGYVDDVNGWNFVEDNNTPQDDSGHGTHVAGIAAANGNNGIGVAGVDWNARIMPLRILNAGGAGTHADAAAALVYAADKGARVINMSFGAYADSQTLRDAVTYAAQTALLVGAAGNSSRSDPFYPAAYPQVIAVAATGPGDVKAAFSNYGDWVDISAPGQTIWSTVYDDGYVGWSGTSMAAPFVAGAASLVWARYPDLSPGSLRRHLLNTAADVDALNPAYAGLLGAGRLALHAALSTQPLPRLSLKEYAVDGVPSGRPEPGTTVGITVTLANTWADASGVIGVLTTTNTYVTLVNDTATFGSIPGDADRANAVPFTVTLALTTPFNSPLPFVLQVSAAGGYSATLPFTITTASSLQNLGSLTIDTDTTWTTDRQYIIGGQVRVLEGVTLTIQPGVLVQFQPAGALVVSGTLIADGTGAAPVVFEGTGAGPWGGITFTDSSQDARLGAGDTCLGGSILRHVRVLSATTGVTVQRAAPFIAQSLFSGNGTGLSVAGGNPLIQNNTFTGNSTGLALSEGSQARVEGNLFQGNTTGLSGSGVAVTVRHNRFTGNGTGLSLDTSGSTTVEGNLIEGNDMGAALSPGWPTSDRLNPDVAYNSGQDEYLVVWEDARDAGNHRIYGQRLSGEGALLGSEIPIAVSGDNHTPRLACDPVGGACLVVYRPQEPVNGAYALVGQMLSADGVMSGTPFTIGTYTGTQSSFAVVANTTQGGYLVAWNDASDGDYDVYAQRVTASGMVTGTQITVIADSINQMDVAAAYNAVTDEYLVVWAENQGLFSGWDLYARRVRADGTFPGIPFLVTGASGDQRNPAVAAEANLGWYTVIWDDNRTGNLGIYGRRVTAGGVLYGNDVLLSTNSPLYPSYPDIVYNASSAEHLIAWTRSITTSQVLGRRISAGGALVPLDEEKAVSAWSYAQGPCAGAWDSARNEYLLTWSDRRDATHWYLYGQRLSAAGALLDNPGTTRNEADQGVNFPVILGASFNHNTVAGNGTGLSVNATDPDLLAAQGNNLVLNSPYNAANAGSGTLGLINNYWGYTSTAQISPTISGSVIVSPFLPAPDGAAPAILWRLFFSREGDPTPVEAREGTNYGPVGAEVLTITLDFSKPMDTSQAPYVTIGNGSVTTYTPTHVVRFGEWISPTRWTGRFQVDWYTGDGVKRVSVSGARGADDGFPIPADRRFTFEVSILAASTASAQGGWGWAALSWPAANLSTVAGYNVYRSTVSGGPYARVNTSIVSGHVYTDTTVANGTTYYYKIAVINTDLQERDYTGEVAVTPDDYTPPSTPLVMDDGAATNSPSILHFRWNAQDPDSGITGYQYAIGTTPGGAQVVNWTPVNTMTETFHVGLNLQEGYTYYVSVKAQNGAGRWSQVGVSDGIGLRTGGDDDLQGPVISTPVFSDTVAADQPLTVTMSIQDAGTGNHGVLAAALLYGYTPPYRQFQAIGTGPGGNGDGPWVFVIPPQGADHIGHVLRFSLIALDADDWPAATTNDHNGTYYAVTIGHEEGIKIFLPLVLRNR